MPFSDRSSILNPLSSPARDIAAAKFVVGIMAEPHEMAKGVRLLESCKARGIPAVLHEVPAVHCSISMAGSDDLSCTRPSFIRYLLDKHRRPVLYLDSGCVMVDTPSAILSMVDEQVGFAAFNWLAEEHTEAYSPISVRAQEGASVAVTSDRYYRYTHSIDLYDPSQLLCSTHVLFWSDSDDARELLKAWQDLIARAPRSPDAHALDFAFNYRGTALPRLKTAWLDKRYMRIGWWIYVKPVIDHPDFFPVHAWTESLEKTEGLPRFDARKFKNLEVDYVFPRDCLIDTVEKMLVRPNFQNGFDVVGPLPVPIWITRY
jgi:hypothetical protein